VKSLRSGGVSCVVLAARFMARRHIFFSDGWSEIWVPSLQIYADLNSISIFMI
jgi:hypothetical protein